MIDLRSDTVTNPTDEMREAAKIAEVGDDVYDDDPTVKKLENLAATMLKKEAAMFVPSGTFGNQVSLLTHTNQGDEIIIGKDSHLCAHEGGGAALISGVMIKALDVNSGLMDLNEIESSIREEDIHFPKTKLIWLENACGSGEVLPIDYLRSVREIANRYNLSIHMDGARIFNAAVSLGIDVSEIAKYADTVQFCLSKGLCAPVGSLVVGNVKFIAKARWYRKMMGGGLRQAGIIAAPGIIALEKMTKRLYVDHENAKLLAKGLDEISNINVMMNRLDINMVFFTISEKIITSSELISKLEANGIIANGAEFGEYRFVTTNDISTTDIDYVINIMRNIVS
ncbi:MAG: low-specificity L-threonine aldolase [Bacilli bacterium]